MFDLNYDSTLSYADHAGFRTGFKDVGKAVNGMAVIDTLGWAVIDTLGWATLSVAGWWAWGGNRKRNTPEFVP